MKYGWMIMLSLAVCASLNDPCQWNQYLRNPGKTGYANCNGPNYPEVLWEAGISYDIEAIYILEEKAMVYSEPHSDFPTPPDITKKPCIDVFDLLTGEFIQKIEPAAGFPEIYPLSDKFLCQTTGRLYEVDPGSKKLSFLAQFPAVGEFCYFRCYPVIFHDKIVFPTTPVVCFSRNDYSVLWNLETSLGAAYPTYGRVLNIAASTDTVFVIIEDEKDAKIVAVNADTGELLWMNNTPDATDIFTDGHTLFVVARNLCALHAQTGELLWVFSCETGFIYSNVVVGTDAVYFTDNKKLYAVNKNGSLRWETQWAGLPMWMTDVIGAGDIVMCSNIYNLTAFSAESGKQVWNVHFQDHIDLSWGKPPPVAAEGIVIVRGKESENSVIAFASDPELFVKQGDAFVSIGQKEEAGQSYGKAFSLYEKKGERKKAEEIRKKAEELGIPLQLPPASQSPPPTKPPPSVSPSPSPSTPPSESPSPSAPPTVSTPLLEKSKIIALSVAAVILVILAAYYFKRKRKTI